MTFLDAIKTCFQKYTDFTGRAARSEYWFFTLFCFGIGLVFTIAETGLLSGAENPTGIYSALFALLTILPSLAVAARRLHDTGRTAWWLLILLVPLIGAAVMIIFACQRGTQGANKFGTDPSLGWSTT